MYADPSNVRIEVEVPVEPNDASRTFTKIEMTNATTPATTSLPMRCCQPAQAWKPSRVSPT